MNDADWMKKRRWRQGKGCALFPLLLTTLILWIGVMG